MGAINQKEVKRLKREKEKINFAPKSKNGFFGLPNLFQKTPGRGKGGEVKKPF